MNYYVYYGVVAGIMLTALVIFLLTVKEKAWAKQMRDDSITLGIEEETAETGEIRNRSDKMTKRTVENCRK